MSIIAIGTDLVEIARIAGVLQRHGDRLGRRILSETEYAEWQQCEYSARYLAKRFAAKEAAAKALGTGFAHGVRWQDIETAHDPHGKPVLRLHAAARARGEALGATRLHLSVSDERQYALAFVVLS